MMYEWSTSLMASRSSTRTDSTILLWSGASTFFSLCTFLMVISSFDLLSRSSLTCAAQV